MANEGLLMFIGFVCLFVLMLAGVFGLVYTLEKEMCEQQGELIGLPYQYTLFTDCMINDNGWIPMDNYRVNREVIRK